MQITGSVCVCARMCARVWRVQLNGTGFDSQFQQPITCSILYSIHKLMMLKNVEHEINYINCGNKDTKNKQKGSSYELYTKIPGMIMVNKPVLLGVKQRSCETTYCFRTFSYYYLPAIGVNGSP